MTTDRTGMVVLDVNECMRRLATHLPRVGRLAFIDDGAPTILPVNYIYADGTILIRTDPGAKLTAALRHDLAAFEIDEVDPTWHEGWSVVVAGRMEEVSDAEELERLRTLPLQAWAGPKAAYLRLMPKKITGRSLA